MADENININVKSNIGDVSKDAGNAASEFRVMGVSLNGVKAGFASAAVTAKGMFGSIKAGLISTGIGAFLVLIGSLFAYFTKTKRGAEMLERAFAGVGAVVNVITDLFSSFGETVVSAFSDPKQAIADLWEAIKTNIMNRVEGLIDTFFALGDTIKAAFSLDWEGVKAGAADFGESMIQTATGVDDLVGKMAEGFKELGAEIKNDVDAAMILKGKLQELRQTENDYSLERAKTMQEIQKARLEALDDSKTAEERLAALQKANDLELQTTRKAIEIQKDKIKIQKETMDLSENMQEDEDKLVALEVEKINMQTQSFQTQKRLATEMETLTNEIRANEKAAQKVIDDEKAEKEKARIASEKLDKEALANWNLERIQNETDAEFKIRIAGAKKLAKTELALKKKQEKEKLDLEKLTEQEKGKTIAMGFAAAKQLAGENEEAAKAVAVAQTIFNTQQAIMKSMADVPYPMNIAQSIATGVMGAVSIQKILSTSSSSASGGGSVSAPAPARPAPQMMSGAFDLSGGMEPEPTRAYVVTDEMTNSQNQLANIRRRATI